MKLRTLSVFAAAAIVSLAACGGDDDVDGDDSTAVAVDTSMAMPAPMPVDTNMAPPMDSAMMPIDSTDTTVAPQ